MTYPERGESQRRPLEDGRCAGTFLSLWPCAGWRGFRSPPPHRTPRPKLELRLRAKQAKVKKGHEVAWEVGVVNRGKSTVTLVQPGDGSDAGWRTPIIEWVIDGKEGGARLNRVKGDGRQAAAERT